MNFKLRPPPFPHKGKNGEEVELCPSWSKAYPHPKRFLPPSLCFIKTCKQYADRWGCGGGYAKPVFIFAQQRKIHEKSSASSNNAILFQVFSKLKNRSFPNFKSVVGVCEGVARGGQPHEVTETQSNCAIL